MFINIDSFAEISKDVRVRGKLEMNKEGPLKFW